MHIYLVDGEMLLCMPMEMIIVGPNLNRKQTEHFSALLTDSVRGRELIV